MLKNQIYQARTKHIDLRFHFVQEITKEGDIRLLRIETADNPADMLTNVIVREKFRYCLDLINVGRKK